MMGGTLAGNWYHTFQKAGMCGEIDLKNPPRRYLGYAYAVCEAFAAKCKYALIPGALVSLAYTAADTHLSFYGDSSKYSESLRRHVFDNLMFHSLATFLIPGLFVRKVAATFMAHKYGMLIIGGGLASLPVVGYGADAITNFALDHTYRLALKYEKETTELYTG